MEPIEYERMYHAENQHWWYLGMASITCAILNQYFYQTKNLNILDAGCGTGAAMSTYLKDYGKVTGFDISQLALKLCKLRNLTSFSLASISEIPYRRESFDLITSFDVLYEQAVIKDTDTMKEFYRVLCPGGFVLLRLPAYDWLRGRHDVAIHTARRYARHNIAKLLEDVGFRTICLTYTNTFLFPLALAKRLLERIWLPAPDASDLNLSVGRFNSLFRRILSSEAPLATCMVLPFGLSVVALGQKP